jgi:hypothetical protein
MNTHKGSCHCGAVTYDVQGDFTEGMMCNCSRCKRLGAVWAYVEEPAFILLTGEDKLTKYQFNKKHIDHLFCQDCGIESYGYGHDGNGHYMYAVNLNCVDDIDTTTLTITQFDGKSV